jgi:hypothetical protein
MARVSSLSRKTKRKRNHGIREVGAHLACGRPGAAEEAHKARGSGRCTEHSRPRQHIMAEQVPRRIERRPR